MDRSSKIISIASKYVGVTEKYNNNVVFNTEYYGHEVSGDQYPWCCAFVWYVFKEAGLSNLFCDGRKVALCQTAMNWFQKQNQWYTSPKIGDCVFYKFGNNARKTDHIGIVESINSDGSINTIEGNTSDKDNRNGGMVLRRTRKSGIVGYGRPKYTGVNSVVTYPKKGVDLSKYQTNINYLNMRAEGVQFAIIKIAGKNDEVDPMFEKHWNGCKNNSIPVEMVYDFCYATTIAEAEKSARAVLKILNGRKVPVALDIETPEQKALGGKVVDLILAYKKIIEGAGLQMVFYTGLSFYNCSIRSVRNQLGTTKMWIARYPSNDEVSITYDPNPAKRPNVDNLVAWQYTQNGRLSNEAYGKALDFDLLYAPIEMTKTAPIKSNPIDVGYVTTTSGSLRVRDMPNINGKVIGYRNNGEKVLVYEIDPYSGWLRIHPALSQWVSNDYVTK